MTKLKIDDGEIEYSIKGEGSPVVLLHGFMMDSTMWNKTTTKLKNSGHKVITYDMRGFGRSSVPDKGYSHVKDLSEILKKLKIEKAKLVATSFSADIALRFSIENPNIVEKLVLIAPTVEGIEQTAESPLPKWKTEATRGKLKAVKEEIKRHKAVVSIQDNNVKMSVVRMIDGYSGWHLTNNDPAEKNNYLTSDRLSEIDCPVDIIIGDNDSPDNVRMSEELANKIKCAKLKRIEELGHFISMERPALIAETILEKEKREEKREIMKIR